MNSRSARLAPLAALLVSASALALGCAEPSAVAPPVVSSEPPPAAPAPPARSAAAPDAVLARVPAEETCMMNNRHMKEPQIPVEVEGRTYYGCCAMCKSKLESDAAARTGTDPVTGRPVDKATAVIGAKPNGVLVYFESEATFDAYVKAGGPPPRDAAATTPASAEVAAPGAKAAPPAPPRAPAAAAPPKAPAPAAPKPAAPPAADPTPAAPPAAGHEHHAH